MLINVTESGLGLACENYLAAATFNKFFCWMCGTIFQYLYLPKLNVLRNGQLCNFSPLFGLFSQILSTHHHQADHGTTPDMINNCSLSEAHCFERRSTRNQVYASAQVETHIRVPLLKIRKMVSSLSVSRKYLIDIRPKWGIAAISVLGLSSRYFPEWPKVFCDVLWIIFRSTYITRQTKQRRFVPDLSLFPLWKFGLGSLFNCINSEVRNLNPTYRFHRVKTTSLLPSSSYKNVVLPGEALFSRTIPLWN